MADNTDSMPVDPDDEELVAQQKKKLHRREYTASSAILDEIADAAEANQDENGQVHELIQDHTIGGRQNAYLQRQYRQQLSPERSDPFADGGKTPAHPASGTSYQDIMQKKLLRESQRQLELDIAQKIKSGELTESEVNKAMAEVKSTGTEKPAKKKRRWDATPVNEGEATLNEKPEEDQVPAHLAKTPAIGNRWDATPAHLPSSSADISDTTSSSNRASIGKRNRWDETPMHKPVEEKAPAWGETPRTIAMTGDDDESILAKAASAATPSKRRSRWDATPADMGATPTLGAQTPVSGAMGATPTGDAMGETPKFGLGATPTYGQMTPSGATPTGASLVGLQTPARVDMAQMTPEQYQQWRYEKEIDARNRPISDEELDTMFPKGYKIVEVPATYEPLRTPSRKLFGTPTPLGQDLGLGGFQMQDVTEGQTADQIAAQAGSAQPVETDLPLLKPDDMQYFDKLLTSVDEHKLSPEEQKERTIMKILLKIKNGTPPMRKSAMRQIQTKTRFFGAGPLFNQILPLLMSPTLEDQERHLLVKVIDRILYKLDDLVRPYVHKILVVIEPLLIDEDYYARVEGREIISNLAKAAGLATMISVMRPDIDNMDEYVRNTTARAFAVVASSLGVPSLLPFLKAVCRSKKSWQARHTGVKIVQQIAILMGCAILPHLRVLGGKYLWNMTSEVLLK